MRTLTISQSVRTCRGRALLTAICIPSFVALASLDLWIPRLQLERGGRETRGEVLRTEPHNHGMADLRFTVAGTSYETKSETGRENPSYLVLKPGDSVYVTYLPSDPLVAMGGKRPIGTAWGWAMMLAVASVMGALAGLVVFWLSRGAPIPTASEGSGNA
jgi:hypothetical protein